MITVAFRQTSTHDMVLVILAIHQTVFRTPNSSLSSDFQVHSTTLQDVVIVSLLINVIVSTVTRFLCFFMECFITSSAIRLISARYGKFLELPKCSLYFTRYLCISLLNKDKCHRTPVHLRNKTNLSDLIGRNIFWSLIYVQYNAYSLLRKKIFWRLSVLSQIIFLCLLLNHWTV